MPFRSGIAIIIYSGESAEGISVAFVLYMLSLDAFEGYGVGN